MSVFDKEKWNKCCKDVGVKFAKKDTPEYDLVLACYRRQTSPKHISPKRILDTFTEEELNEIFHAMDILEKKRSPKRSPKISPKISPKAEIKLNNIVEMLNHANKTIKSPSIQIVTDDATYSLTIAGEQAQLPGTINVVSKSIWYGRIFLDGKFQASKKIPEPVIEQLINELQAFNHNPEKMARAYGRRTGRCCFCNLPLTNEKSIEVGYGPVCARNYRLYYGKK